ncbi:MAG: murein L,D-transpeptidase family protein, partial [Flavobacteriales bacterium]
MVRIAAAVCITAILTGTNTFRDKQQKYKRVAEAYLQKEGSLKSMFRSKGMDYNTFRMCVVIYKKEQRLKVFIKGDGGEPYSCLKDYAICFSSGELGPKRQQGDFQVPEGFYYINRFNPVSSFHLSLGINYPNASDRTLGKSHPGGDIF